MKEGPAYTPAPDAAPVVNVAPTRMFAVPAVRVPVNEGVLVHAEIVKGSLAPEAKDKFAAGSVMLNAEAPSPVTVKEAALTVPPNNTTPTTPVRVATGKGLSIKEPDPLPLVKVPKFMSVTFAIASGVMIVAVAFAVVVALIWAKPPAAKASITNVSAKFFIFIIFIIFKLIIKLFYIA